MSEPLTRKEALAHGFRPVPNVDKLVARHGITIEEFAQRKNDYAADMQVKCNNQTVGQVCFDWTDDNNVRTICYCTAAQTCDDCVQK